MNSIKPFFKNTLPQVISEDLNLKEMNPRLVGLYSLCQAINKVGNQSPFPVPTIDIIPTDKRNDFGSNPVHFTFSKNSFKVYINPKIGLTDFADGGGHDLMHALTTNIAKKFARERAGADFGRSAFKGSPSRMTSKANLNKVSPKAFQGISKELAQFGIDFRTINSPDALKQTLDTLGAIKDKAITRGKENPALAMQVDKLGKKMKFTVKTHFSPSLKVGDADVVNLSRDKYEKEYGVSDEGGAGDFGLPQYEAEENFGNAIANSIRDFVSNGHPINIESVIKRIQLAAEEGTSELELSLLDSWYGKMEKFLVAVFETYNKLLPKYESMIRQR